MKFAPGTNLIVVGLDVEQMANTPNVIHPKAWWNAGLKQTGRSCHQHELVRPLGK